MEQLRSLFGSFSPLGYRGSRADGHDLGTLAGVGKMRPQNGLSFWGFLGDQELSSYMGITPRKFNIAPKNRQSQKETHLPTIIFQGLC